ncbi:hypothetical protein AB6A40_003748 [Gnathostoma spinigerum]|uniref:Uncharacterized protein n=1 Tax=Gnathostoma spinigerum TaxID=75299 RepID=A0ABD6EAF6_9BILA
MNVDFQFSSLIGSTYKNGNVLFSVDGNSVLSPVGNKVSLFDLKSDIASTIDVESSFSIKVIALNPTGSHLFVVNEVGDGLYINLRTQTLLFRQRFNSSVGDVQFSPNGRHLAVCREGEVQIFSIADFRTQAFNPFILQKTFKISSESVRHLDWSYDSKLLAAGADDKQVRVVAAGDQYQNLVVYSIASHKGSIVGNYFLNKSFDLVTVDKRGFANIWSCSINSEDIVEGKYIKDMDEKVKKLEYKKSERCNLREQVKQPAIVDLTATAYHPQTSLLIVAFSNGVFCLFEAPTFNLIHNLRF